MSNNRLWLSTIINLQRQVRYMYLQIDQLEDPLRTSPIQMGREMSIEQDPNRQFAFIDYPVHQFGDGSVPTRTRTRSDGLEPLLTLATLVRSNLGFSFSSDSISCRIQISYCHVQNIKPRSSLSLFVLLAAFIIKTSRDMVPATSWSWV